MRARRPLRVWRRRFVAILGIMVLAARTKVPGSIRFQMKTQIAQSLFISAFRSLSTLRPALACSPPPDARHRCLQTT